MEQKTILVTLDGSSQSEAALPYALAIAKATSASLRLLTVVETTFERLIGHEEELNSELNRRKHEHVDAYLAAIVGKLSGHGSDASTAVAEGEASEQILAAASAAEVSMVVMATRGYSGLQRWVLGSVADKIMRMSDRPVLLVRPPEAPEPDRTVVLRRLLVPLDGSPLAEAALAPAAALAQATGATLFLVRAEQWVATTLTRFGDMPYVEDIGQWEEEVAAAARDYLSGMRARVPAEVPAETRVLRGIPTLVLEEFIEQQQIDLVVMTSRGRSGLPRFVLGSTADHLIRTGAPTLLIPAAPSSDAEPKT